MLWDSIYEFFVKYVFGGSISGETYLINIGDGVWFLEGVADDYGAISSNDVGFKLAGFGDYSYGMPLGNYFSLIATIITIVAIVIFCIIIIKKIFSICFNLFTGRSIF